MIKIPPSNIPGTSLMHENKGTVMTREVKGSETTVYTVNHFCVLNICIPIKLM